MYVWVCVPYAAEWSLWRNAQNTSLRKIRVQVQSLLLSFEKLLSIYYMSNENYILTFPSSIICVIRTSDKVYQLWLVFCNFFCQPYCDLICSGANHSFLSFALVWKYSLLLSTLPDQIPLFFCDKSCWPCKMDIQLNILKTWASRLPILWMGCPGFGHHPWPWFPFSLEWIYWLDPWTNHPPHPACFQFLWIYWGFPKTSFLKYLRAFLGWYPLLC